MKAAGVSETDATKKACDEEAAKKTAEESAKSLEDRIAQAVNKAMEPLMAGLKSKKDGEGAPGSGNEDPEVVKALKALQCGDKSMKDFPRHIQRKLEDFSALAYEQIAKSMPDRPGVSGATSLK